MSENTSHLGIMLLDELALCIACALSLPHASTTRASARSLLNAGKGQLHEHDAIRIAKLLDNLDASSLTGQLRYDGQR